MRKTSRWGMSSGGKIKRSPFKLWKGVPCQPAERLLRLTPPPPSPVVTLCLNNIAAHWSPGRGGRVGSDLACTGMLECLLVWASSLFLAQPLTPATWKGDSRGGGGGGGKWAATTCSPSDLMTSPTAKHTRSILCFCVQLRPQTLCSADSQSCSAVMGKHISWGLTLHVSTHWAACTSEGTNT